MRPASLASRRAIPSLLLLNAIQADQSGDGHVPLCYYPDGTIATNDSACRLNTTESFCCTTNVNCLDNKICDVQNPTQYRYNRGTCTDKTWISTDCPQFCLAQAPDYGCGIIRCPDADGKVCCENDGNDANATCCHDDSNLFELIGDWDVFRAIDKSAASSTRALSGSGSTSAAATGSGATASTGSGQQDADREQGLQAGAIAGIAVGSVAGASVLIALALWAIRRMRRPKGSLAAVEADGTGVRHEMKADETRYELGAGQDPHELGSGDETHEMEGSSPLDLNVINDQEQQGQ